MWLLTTHRRPERLLELLQSMKKHGVKTPGFILVNGGEQPTAEYEKLRSELPKGWIMSFDTKDRTHGEATQYLFEMCENKIGSAEPFDWYGVIADDGVVNTELWDVKLVHQAMQSGMSSANDLHNAPHRIGCCHVIRADILRALGWIVPPGLKHMYIDDVWETVGRDLGIWVPLMDVIVEHKHYLFNKAKMDDSYKNSSRYMHSDGMRCQTILQNRQEIYSKIRHLTGSAHLDVDLRGKKVAICIPTHGGSLKIGNAFGLLETQNACHTFGIDLNIFNSIGNASICDTRNRLVKMFLDSGMDYLMFIDDDIGFKANDLLRLLAWDKDVVAGAAPKRGLPITFCCHLPKKIVQDKGTVGVESVGTGFMLIKREAMLKFMKKHCNNKELGWYHDPNQLDPFPNIFRERVTWDGKTRIEVKIGDATFSTPLARRTGEDYSFCEMMKEAGCSVWIDPSIKLTHYGAWEWSASIEEVAAQKETSTDGNST